VRVLVTRPEADARPLAERLQTLGAEAVIAPLLTVVPRGDADIDLDGIQAVLATSANGVRALAAVSPRRDLPIYAVGDASAACARDEGFATVISAAGDVQSLASVVADALDPAAGTLLHVAGTAVAGDLAGALGKAGFAVRRTVLYEAETAAALPAVAEEGLREGSLDAVLLFSPRTARTFVRLVASAGLAARCQTVDALCLSPAVAEAVATLEWRRLRVAATPDQDSLLQLLGRED
jgi:uroporphyrinogen-III synthase